MNAGRFVMSAAAQWSPAVGGIMLACGCTRQEAFYAYFALLAYIHEFGRGGKAHATQDEIDRRAELPGFAAAMVRLGWIKFDEPFGTPMRWTWKLRKGHITKVTAAKLAAKIGKEVQA